MPAAARSFLRTRASLVVLGVLTLVGGRVAGAQDPKTPPSQEVGDLLAEWIEHKGPPPPGRLVEILRKLRNLQVQVPPTCPGLTCSPGPTPKHSKLPPAPYDPEGNDCVLVGRAAEVGNYLNALEAMVLACLDFAERSHAAAVAAKSLLDAQVAVLPDGGRPPRSSGDDRVWYSLLPDVGSHYTAFFPDREPPPPPPSRSRRVGRPRASLFTHWLGELTLWVEEFCDDAHRTYEPLERVCSELNHVLCRQEGRLLDELQRAQFLERLDSAMQEVVAVLEHVRRWAPRLTEWGQTLLEAFSEAIVCPVAPTPTDVLARQAAEQAFHDFVRSADEEARIAWRSRVGVGLWLDGRLYLLEVPVASLR